MEEQSSKTDIIKSFVKKNILVVVLFSVGMILLGIGLIQLVSPQKGQDIEFVAGNVEGEKTETVTFYVHVAGAVMKPGVYKVSQDARIQDALIAAGGLSTNANRDFVEKNLNLAQKIADGTKIYIPTRDENTFSGSIGLTTSASGQVNINSAGQSTLEALPKIGAVTAQKIISSRPYTTVDELVQKKVITQKTFDAIKEMITVY